MNTSFGGIYFRSSPGTDFVIGKKNINSAVYFQVRTSAGAELLTIDEAGNVGIGTTNPLAALAVGATSQFQVNSSGAIAAATGITSSGTITFSGLAGDGAETTAVLINGKQSR